MRSFGRELQPVLHSLKEEMGSCESKDYSTDVRKSLSSKIEEIEVKISEEKKLRLDAQKHLIRITATENRHDKTLLNTLIASIKDVDKDITFLSSALQQLKDMSAERWGLNPKYLQSLAEPQECTYLCLRENTTNTRDLCIGNPRTNRGPCNNKTKELLAGTPAGLCAYLYSREAFNQSYVRDFFIMFRQFMKVAELADFLMKRHTLASNKVTVDGFQSNEVQSQILYRTIDIFMYWATNFSQSDFKNNDHLKRKIKLFVKRSVQQWDSSDSVQRILDILVTGRSISQESMLPSDNKGTLTKSPIQQHVHKVIDQLNREKFKVSRVKSSSLTNLGMKFMRSTSSPVLHAKSKKTAGGNEQLFGVDIKHLVHQFCLLEQKVYEPMDILCLINTRKSGVRSIEREFNTEAPIEQFLKWHDSVTTWTILVILSAINTKIQAGMIQKFAILAKQCAEERNFSSAMQIFSALCDEQIYKLPVMMQIPLKTTFLLEDLHLIRECLTNETNWISSANSIPLLPPLKIFLCHIQHLEIGSFLIGNKGVIKWNKCREIAEMVDCMRHFQNNGYPFETDELLRHRVANEIHTISQADEIELRPNHRYYEPHYSSKRTKINMERIKALFT